MNNNEIWNAFLENIKKEITDISFDTWFSEEDTKFYDFKDNVLTITVNQEFIKKHIEDHYLEIMNDAIYKVTNSNVTFNIVLVKVINLLIKQQELLLRHQGHTIHYSYMEKVVLVKHI